MNIIANLEINTHPKGKKWCSINCKYFRGNDRGIDYATEADCLIFGHLESPEYFGEASRFNRHVECLQSLEIAPETILTKKEK